MRDRTIVACVSVDEHARVLALAKARGITVSQLIVNAINSLLLDEDDDSDLVTECDSHDPTPTQRRDRTWEA